MGWGRSRLQRCVSGAAMRLSQPIGPIGLIWPITPSPTKIQKNNCNITCILAKYVVYLQWKNSLCVFYSVYVMAKCQNFYQQL